MCAYIYILHIHKSPEHSCTLSSAGRPAVPIAVPVSGASRGSRKTIINIIVIIVNKLFIIIIVSSSTIITIS